MDHTTGVVSVEEALRSCTMHDFIVFSYDKAPLSPVCELVEQQTFRQDGARTVSPALSFVSNDSLESISLSASTITEDSHGHAPTAEELEAEEANQHIYRLCCSLYKRAVSRVRAAAERHASSPLTAHKATERNMRLRSDWLPLLHLFDPKTFFARAGSNPSSRTLSTESMTEHPNHGTLAWRRRLVAHSPREAMEKIMDELSVEKLSGGNSNHVYRLGHPDFPNKTILLRVYGSGGDDVIDRYRDVLAMKHMSKAKYSPSVLHTFKWGRVEEFMNDVATATTDMVLSSPSLLASIYRTLHATHQLSHTAFLPEAANAERFKRFKELPFFNLVAGGDPDLYCQRSVDVLVPALSVNADCPYYHSWTEVKALEDVCPTSFERATLRLLRLTSVLLRDAVRDSFIPYMCAEVMRVREAIRAVGSPCVFSHNDCNPGNVLLSYRYVPPAFRPEGVTCDEEDEVTSILSDQTSEFSRKFLTVKGKHKNLVEMRGVVFIDFEYSDANYRSFDLGNTFCELDYDYSRGTGEGEPGFIKYLSVFPPEAYRERWASCTPQYPRLPELIYDAWMAASSKSANTAPGATTEAAEAATATQGEACLGAILAYFKAGDPTVTSVSRTQLVEVFLGMMAAHLHWSVWSFVMGCNPDECTNLADDDDGFAKGSSGLDYIYYGDCRLKEYIELKRWMMERGLLKEE